MAETAIETTPVVREETQPPTKGEVAAGIGIVALAVAGFAWLIKKDVDYQNKIEEEDKKRRAEMEAKRQADVEAIRQREEEQNRWENEQRMQGRTLYKLSDGRTLAVAADAAQETFLRR